MSIYRPLLNINSLSGTELKAAGTVHLYRTFKNIKKSNLKELEKLRDLLVNLCPSIYFKGETRKQISDRIKRQKEEKKARKDEVDIRRNKTTSQYTIVNDDGEVDWIFSQNLYKTMRKLRDERPNENWEIQEQCIPIYSDDGELDFINPVSFVEKMEKRINDTGFNWSVY